MDAIKAEIERKRKALEEKELITSQRKYFKRGELEAKEREEYLKKHQPSQTAQTAPSDAAPPAADKADALTILTKNIAVPALPVAEVIRRLRERGEPIRLFGETDEERALRLRRHEILEPEVNKGLRNDFMDAMETVDQEFLDKLLKQSDAKDEAEERAAQGEEEKTLHEEIMRLWPVMLNKGNYDDDQEFILKYLNFLLRLFEIDLASRPDDVKRSMQGKLASATFKQTVGYIKPLLRHLKKRTLSPSIREFMVEIVDSMLQREYVQASDAYLRMAIGNAPWPMGVTMVGIHSRPGREKVGEKNIAHVLNDETQRKYIQALKRLMTFCQRRFPTDPSKSVEYQKQS